MPREAQPEELKREYEELQKKYDDLLLSYELLQKDYDEFLNDQKNIFKVSRERDILKSKVRELKDELEKFRGLEDSERFIVRGFISLDQGITRLFGIRSFANEIVERGSGRFVAESILRIVADLEGIKESLVKANNK